ncbi:PGF-CTERM sorting domain-containing protein [Natronolimnohabitans sp. A-GB9]|uniref:PGF-CTERM sorting domain-containing protein n=1 Tax=Natronolimnohabitans sp. A-GB9 TaxID=3069757 RepID=UPI0027B2C115|nr:PGF-CTERM sorting domain-containing protein [Natronolimnohabitans sp. A-GB9]MDQ2052597.1 PGF-CTERM sorting domain-containing protein [Natronolimnohabitans sp. A-GB9]
MRRSSLSVVAIVFLLVVSGTAGVAQPTGMETDVDAQLSTQSADSYVVEQGDVCQEIEPLSTSETVESFYDYRNHDTEPEGLYSSYGTTHLQEDETSILFLHEGTDGMSLVMVHDQLEGDSDGGYVTFDIVGLPGESEWVVENDNYSAETNIDEFHRGDGWAEASWIWRGARTGGGAIQGGLNDEFGVTIQPAFNEDARITHENHDHPDSDFYDEGELEDWEVLSGDADDPDRTTLPSLEEPVTIRTGTCGDPSVTYDRTDDGITASIDGAAADDQIALQPPSGTADNATFEAVEVTGVDGSGTIAFENQQPADLPASPPGVESLSYLTMTSDEIEDGSATVTVSVDAALLEEHGLEPEDVALYGADGDEWIEGETTVSDESGATYQFTGEVASLEAVTVAEQQEPESESESEFPMPGFGVLGALVMLLLAALWAVRRTDE